MSAETERLENVVEGRNIMDTGLGTTSGSHDPLARDSTGTTAEGLKTSAPGEPLEEAKMARVAISKSLRFDIFHRDGFTCQYCGSRPPDVVLEIDHITPVAAGGKNDEMNLVTACDDCNAGKSAKILGSYKPKPDADEHYLKAEQERVEYERYLTVSKWRDEAKARVVERIQDHWVNCFNTENTVAERVVLGWLSTYSPETIEAALEATIPAVMRGQFDPHRWRGFDSAIKYASAIMRNLTYGRES